MTTNSASQSKEVRAFGRYIHVSPRKLRLVADMVRKQPVDAALEQLRFSAKNAALPLTKVINSAIANAVHNFNLSRENLYIKSLTIDGGPVYKKYAPRAQGRAFVERKRTSHINLILESKTGQPKPRRSIFSKRPQVQVPAEEIKKDVDQPEAGSIEAKQQAPKQAPKSMEKVKRNIVDLKRRLFNRRSGA
jgi:large subunit ribosomal protein L22